MHGLTLYIWHEGKDRYDEVTWLPRSTDERAARQLAELKLRVDKRATKVQVEFGNEVIEICPKPSEHAA